MIDEEIESRFVEQANRIKELEGQVEFLLGALNVVSRSVNKINTVIYGPA